MLDEQKWIGSQAVIKAIIDACPEKEIVESRFKWIKNEFDFCTKLMENYATLHPRTEDKPEIKETPKNTDWPPPDRDSKLAEVITLLSALTEKEYKPKKFRYGIKDIKGNWYSTFFKQHFLNAQDAKNSGHEVRILYEIGEYNGRPQFTVQSLDIV